jgi:aldehyde:ferredoxin oxidoreductase
MGADHTAGWVVGQNLAAFGGKLDPLSPQGQVEASRAAQIATAAFDSTGLCQFAATAVNDIPAAGQALLTLLSVKLGTALTPADVTALGVRVIKAEREFNRKAGLTNKADRLAKFFYEEPLPPHNKPVLVSDQEMDRTFDF